MLYTKEQIEINAFNNTFKAVILMLLEHVILFIVTLLIISLLCAKNRVLPQFPLNLVIIYCVSASIHVTFAAYFVLFKQYLPCSFFLRRFLNLKPSPEQIDTYINKEISSLEEERADVMGNSRSVVDRPVNEISRDINTLRSFICSS